ncbi:keratinocyte differentiation factor 1-like [Cololabis saira]|uniref:keratinocyte differentiation factor 1-like n=1 Tax=Cololabis saira TaxID=129043 RepID=UPI002AD4D667|nr:keratinocyte differentiation factor 1-like [Cololabis saira]
MSAGGAGGPRSGPGSGSSSHEFWEERCVDPVEDRPPAQKPKPYLGDANGKAAETIGFIPGSAETGSASRSCNPCAPPSGCPALVCSVLTCGLYRVCRRSVLAPCLAPAEGGSAEEPEKLSLRGENPGDDPGDPGGWNDIHIAGVRVVGPGDPDPEPPAPRPEYPSLQGSYPSLPRSVQLEDWDLDGDGDEQDLDSLITRKLLQLYSEYQIQELARCTSDSLFQRKTRDIDRLINALAEEHQLDEQEAECRLVRGIIRISTRRSRKRTAVTPAPAPAPQAPKTDRRPSDSGNETWNGSSSLSCSNNNDYRSSPNIQISELTPSDKCARDMWRRNRGNAADPGHG